MGYYIEFYKALDKKLNDGLTVMVMLSILLGTTITIFSFANFKESVSGFEGFLLSLVGALILLAVIAGIIAVVWGIYKWFSTELIPKFKETRKDFGYVPPVEGKVDFK